jgi:hypothetical protein
MTLQPLKKEEKMGESPIDEFLENSLDKFELYLKENYVKENVDIRMRGARLFVEFLRGRKTPKHTRLKP